MTITSLTGNYPRTTTHKLPLHLYHIQRFHSQSMQYACALSMLYTYHGLHSLKMLTTCLLHSSYSNHLTPSAHPTLLTPPRIGHTAYPHPTCATQLNLSRLLNPASTTQPTPPSLSRIHSVGHEFDFLQRSYLLYLAASYIPTSYVWWH